MRETSIYCDECKTKITNGKPFQVGINRDKGTAYIVASGLENIFDSRFDIKELCSEGCLIKFEAKLREKL